MSFGAPDFPQPRDLGPGAGTATGTQLAHSRAAIAKIHDGEQGGYDETIWPSVRTCRYAQLTVS
jgi:hypothetical protein